MDSLSEIRKILTGRYTVVDNIIVAYTESAFKNVLGWQGVSGGAANALTLGIHEETREYTFPLDVENAEEEILKILINYGKVVALTSEPDSVGFLRRAAGGIADLYVVRAVDFNTVCVSVYTSRSATSQINSSRAFKVLENELSDKVTITFISKEKKKK